MKILQKKFVGYNIINGRKALSLKVFFSSFKNLKLKYKLNPFEFFYSCFLKLAPVIFLKKYYIKRGNVLKEVPVRINQSKKLSIFINWVLKGLKKNKKKSFVTELTKILSDVYNNKGDPFLKREDYYKKCIAGKINLFYFKR